MSEDTSVIELVNKYIDKMKGEHDASQTNVSNKFYNVNSNRWNNIMTKKGINRLLKKQEKWFAENLNQESREAREIKSIYDEMTKSSTPTPAEEESIEIQEAKSTEVEAKSTEVDAKQNSKEFVLAGQDPIVSLEKETGVEIDKVQETKRVITEQAKEVSFTEMGLTYGEEMRKNHAEESAGFNLINEATTIPPQMQGFADDRVPNIQANTEEQQFLGSFTDGSESESRRRGHLRGSNRPTPSIINLPSTDTNVSNVKDLEQVVALRERNVQGIVTKGTTPSKAMRSEQKDEAQEEKQRDEFSDQRIRDEILAYRLLFSNNIKNDRWKQLNSTSLNVSRGELISLHREYEFNVREHFKNERGMKVGVLLELGAVRNLLARGNATAESKQQTSTTTPLSSVKPPPINEHVSLAPIGASLKNHRLLNKDNTSITNVQHVLENASMTDKEPQTAGIRLALGIGSNTFKVKMKKRREPQELHALSQDRFPIDSRQGVIPKLLQMKPDFKVQVSNKKPVERTKLKF